MNYQNERLNLNFDYPEGAIFSVYIRRSNCRKRLIYCGKDIHQAVEVFSYARVYKLDRKYIFANDKKIVLVSGTIEKPDVSRRAETAKNYESKPVMAPRIPISLFYSLRNLRTLEVKGAMINNALLINLLLARACEMDKTELIKMLETAFDNLTKHQVMSGMNNHEDAKEYLEIEEML